MSKQNKEIEKKVEQVAAEILRMLELEGTAQVDFLESDGKDYVDVKLQGDDLAVLIGHHGKTLDAMRTILNLVVRKELNDSDTQLGVLLDVNSYHAKREDYIRQLSNTAIDQVKMSQQPMELLPMRPAERRIVHLTLQDHPDLTTESIGEGPERRVVIKPVE